MLERLETSGPEHPIVFEPVIEFAEGPRVEPVDAGSGIATFTNQAGLPEYPQVAGDRRARDRELLRDLSGGTLTASKQVENLPAGRVGDGVVQGRGMRNHEVT